jgi:hypothetical protein
LLLLLLCATGGDVIAGSDISLYHVNRIHTYNTINILIGHQLFWKIHEKGILNSEIIWKKDKSNSGKIWTIWKKGKLNSEKIWKLRVLHHYSMNMTVAAAAALCYRRWRHSRKWHQSLSRKQDPHI